MAITGRGNVGSVVPRPFVSTPLISTQHGVRPTPPTPRTAAPVQPTQRAPVAPQPVMQQIDPYAQQRNNNQQQLLTQLRTMMSQPAPVRPPQPMVSAPAAPAAVTFQAPSTRSSGPSLAFSRAKDASGRVGNSALSALRDEFSSRGMGGSSLEAGAVADVIKDTARYQSEAEAEAQALEDQREWDAAMASYQGGITQRGQNIGVGGTGYQGQVQQRGQNIDDAQAQVAAAQQRQEAMMQALLTAFRY